ncbi:hypothetical protein [Methylobacterium aerolatum]|uniref:Uncharacterized protein n=1 Tax=Methylobacterium aerolatum TaxID=418708 RepID=A0ABU0HYY1_9HYPH|nr:hypothetical protein [Methylobacterium aerolatum]MDQ0446890.1 hypothetical protein [Methylobacterium aerolatum]GJD33855.1 hypothetical protein FMGBMHLM_0750 [Methylobacterium aerolatum]
MDANDRALVRPVTTDAALAERRRLDSETLWVALRADRRSRDERTARLRAMTLAAAADLDQ